MRGFAGTLTVGAKGALKSRVREAGSGDGRGYWHLCPDFVIELRSETDRLKPLQKKSLRICTMVRSWVG